jgi:hypothetical protein
MKQGGFSEKWLVAILKEADGLTGEPVKSVPD